MTDSDGAKAALNRIVIPQDALDRMAEMMAPRSSLIISDEELSAETGKDTEFVVIPSGEPQGGSSRDHAIRGSSAALRPVAVRKRCDRHVQSE